MQATWTVVGGHSNCPYIVSVLFPAATGGRGGRNNDRDLTAHSWPNASLVVPGCLRPTTLSVKALGASE